MFRRLVGRGVISVCFVLACTHSGRFSVLEAEEEICLSLQFVTSLFRPAIFRFMLRRSADLPGIKLLVELG